MQQLSALVDTYMGMSSDRGTDAAVLAHARATPASGVDLGGDLAARVIVAARRTALGVLGDREAAADVAQEVALEAFRQRRALRDPEALMGWVHRVAVRVALREARRSRRRHAAEQARAARLVGASPHGRLDCTLAILDGLPPRQRAALTLRYVHDLPDTAIARALRCRPATVRSLLFRGREAVRARIEEDAR
jgi:RNA polymerase sigma factor (sigma-70 family)